MPADGDDLLEPIVNNSEDEEDDDDDDEDEDTENGGGRDRDAYHDDDHELLDGAVVDTSNRGHSSRQSRFAATGHHGAPRRGTKQQRSIRFART